MKILKFVGAAAFAVVALFVLLANFSAAESRFECSRSVSGSDGSLPTMVYLRLEQYRWWVGLWSDSDAALWVEIPSEAVEYFSDVREVGDQLQVFDSGGAIKGNFSTLSHVLAIQTSLGFFDGKCRVIDA